MTWEVEIELTSEWLYLIISVLKCCWKPDREDVSTHLQFEETVLISLFLSFCLILLKANHSWALSCSLSLLLANSSFFLRSVFALNSASPFNRQKTYNFLWLISKSAKEDCVDNISSCRVIRLNSDWLHLYSNSSKSACQISKLFVIKRSNRIVSITPFWTMLAFLLLTSTFLCTYSSCSVRVNWSQWRGVLSQLGNSTAASSSHSPKASFSRKLE